jgi:cytochrome c-type biogenesis protein CcmE
MSIGDKAVRGIHFHRRVKIIATLVVALAGIGYVAAQSLREVKYFAMVFEVTNDPPKYLAKNTVQVAGFVVPGSIKTEIRDQQTYRTFKIEAQGKEIWVDHTGTVPDVFKDNAQTVVTGKLEQRADGEIWMHAKHGDDGVSAKCPSKYNGMR